MKISYPHCYGFPRVEPMIHALDFIRAMLRGLGIGSGLDTYKGEASGIQYVIVAAVSKKPPC